MRFFTDSGVPHARLHQGFQLRGVLLDEMAAVAPEHDRLDALEDGRVLGPLLAHDDGIDRGGALGQHPRQHLEGGAVGVPAEPVAGRAVEEEDLLFPVRLRGRARRKDAQGKGRRQDCRAMRHGLVPPAESIPGTGRPDKEWPTVPTPN
jgi:hypothetical protein